MQNPRDILTPEALAMLQTIGGSGSFAAAARVLGLVPSALTYRVRQIEDALDVLLFDRSAKQAQPTAAGQALLQEAGRLLSDVDAVANRVKRVSTGWEPQFTIAVDSIISKTIVMELCESFLGGGGARCRRPNLLKRLAEVDVADSSFRVCSGRSWGARGWSWRGR